MLKKVVFTLIGLAVLIGVPTVIKLKQFETMGSAQMEMPPETVTSDQVRSLRWPNRITATGSLVAVQGVTVTAELGGKIEEIAFESGDRVKKGDLLVRIDV
ncbi:MAG: biotin/lipoyl-binding protein, partial [Candidatus Thiodiazotropha sp.]